MIISRLSSTKNRPLWLVWCLVIALALRGLIPAGYMPDAAHRAGGLLALTICSGSGPQTIYVDGSQHRVDPARHPDHGQPQADEHNFCPFSFHAGLPFSPVAGLAAPFGFALLSLAALTGFGFVRQRSFSNASPRGPPVFS